MYFRAPARPHFTRRALLNLLRFTGQAAEERRAGLLQHSVEGQGSLQQGQGQGQGQCRRRGGGGGLRRGGWQQQAADLHQGAEAGAPPRTCVHCQRRDTCHSCVLTRAHRQGPVSGHQTRGTTTRGQVGLKQTCLLNMRPTSTTNA